MHYVEYPCGYKAKVNFYGIIYDAIWSHTERIPINLRRRGSQYDVLCSYLRYIEDMVEREEF